MMRISKWIFQLSFTLCLLPLVPAIATPQTKFDKDAAPQHLKTRVLFIGNSYTYFNNLPQIVSELAKSARDPKQLEAEMVTVGGATLKRLWEGGKALEAIKRSDWDYVVLQEQSTLGPTPMVNGVPQISNPKVFHEYARLFDSEIKKASAKTIFYLTWARQNAPETQAALTDAYLTIAKELNAIVAPVGIAWEIALKRNPQLGLHIQDKSHPSPTGSYLAACVFFATIYGKSPEGLAGQINGTQMETSGKIKDSPVSELVNLNQSDAVMLQRVAWVAVKNNH